MALPVESLSDEQAAAYGRYGGIPSRAERERFFFLDDEDKKLIGKHRADHLRLGLALQLTTVRYLGTFLPDPLAVPSEVIDYLAEQLEIADPSCVKAYAERRMTRFQHAWEIRRACGLVEFDEVEADLEAWVDARAWTTGEGPKAIFDGAVAWLRERQVLLPGVTTLTRLVARCREAANQRLWDSLATMLTSEQRGRLELLLEVPKGARVSELDRLRKGPVKPSGPSMIKALERIAEITGLGIESAELGAIPQRRLIELGRYGMAGKAAVLRRQPESQRLATLLATVACLKSKSVDDALELLDLLMVTELLARAERESSRETLRRYPRFSRESAKLAAAVEVLLEAIGGGTELSLEQVWESIEAVVPRAELAAAVAAVTELAPPPDADRDGEWRAELVKRITTVRGFLPMLCGVIEFEATAEGEPVLTAMAQLPELMGLKATRRVQAGQLPAHRIAAELVTGSWRRLVYRSDLPEGVVDKPAYVFCILEQFHRHLRRRDIYAEASARWRDPRAQLLEGAAWEAAKGSALNALQLPEHPEALLADHARVLDMAYREVSERLETNTAVSVDSDGRLHVERIQGVPDPPSLVDLGSRLQALMPRVDLPEIVLEVMSWHPQFVDAFTAVSGGEARLSDLHITIAAVLTAHALNVGYTPIIQPEVPALTRARISHVDQNYMRFETYGSANAPLIEAQADIPLAQTWGGGLVASVDGMRFVVPVPTVFARPNPLYFGRKRGATWLNMVNDQALGLGGRVVSGTPRESLHLIDVIYSQEGGRRPEIIVTDSGPYSDMVFALVHLLGMDYRPQLADLPDQKLWRITRDADYGPLKTAARGQIDVGKICRHWVDISRVVASIHTGAVRAYEVIRMLQRDGHPTPLGDAFAHYGRVFKSLHILRLVDDEAYRRGIKAQNNLQESRHELARRIFHGQKGELRQRYHEGMEDQLGALGLVLNCVTLWNTVYLNAAVEQLRQQGYPVLEEDLVRLSPFIRTHINVQGHYSFQLPELGGRHRELRDPDAAADDEH